METIRYSKILLYFIPWLLLAPNPGADSAKILVATFMSTMSHKITYEPLIYKLAARGHKVTVLMPIVSGKKMANLREIQTIPIEQIMSRMPNWFELREKGQQANSFMMLDFHVPPCRATYAQPHVLQVLNERFDAVIMSAVFNECTAGFVYKLNTTLILVSPVTAPTWVASVLGAPSPPSFVPDLFSEFDDRMTFWERIVNLWMGFFTSAIRKFYFQPIIAGIYREALGDPSIPEHDEIIKNASLMLTVSHISLNKPRPLLPDIVEVGGMQCRPAQPLPADLETFLNSSGSDGFIFFSMGSAMKGSLMPERYRQIFIRVFGQLKQKVLWKWETEHMDDLPPNVKLSKWFPQQDVLGHPKIKAFITHGGFGGTTEAVYHGVPLIGMPMLGDQHLNMRKSVEAGFAVSLEFTTLTEETLLDAVRRVVSDPKYRERVQALSSTFRDQPDMPLDRAVFWTEYVIRHRGALHMRSAGRDLSWCAYHSIDVIATLFGILLLVAYVIFAILRCGHRAMCGKAKKSASKSKKSD